MLRFVLLASSVLLVSSVAVAAPRAPQKPPPITRVDTSALSLVETVEKPSTDYQAEVYSGVPLDEAYARERGLSKGLVLMVFEKQRKPAFRVPHERIKKVVRFLAEDGAPVMLVKAAASPARTKVDVLETDDGWVAIETATTNGGIFTTSEVYVFGKGTTLEQRQGALGSAPPVSRERLRRALGMAAAAKSTEAHKR
ncbi:MAG: hypothetical protein QM702_20775 [Rubrivivax sp.]